MNLILSLLFILSLLEFSTPLSRAIDELLAGIDDQGAVVEEERASFDRDKELWNSVSTLYKLVVTLNEKVEALSEQNSELSTNLANLQIAAKDLLYNKYVELEEQELLAKTEDVEEEEAEGYGEGRWVDPDAPDRSLWYLRKAAEAGHAVSQLQLGVYYDQGYSGLNRSSLQALEWYKKAALQDLPEAQCYVGVAYHMGRGVNQSDDLAKTWYLLAALNNDPIAQNNLGWLLLTGGKSNKPTTAKMEMEAVEWFTKSAEQNEAFGKANLGLCYTLGAGGLQVDLERALELYREIDSEDVERYAAVALEETPIWRNNMMKWFTVAANAGERLASIILLIHNKTDISGETYMNGMQSM